MIDSGEFKRAQFSYTGPDGAQQFDVDFNPSTMDYTVTINAQGEGGQTQQAAGQASAKLNLELIFDSTDTGDDVRAKTNKVEKMLRPSAGTGGANAPQAAPPMVTFEWGAFKFVGLVDSFKQTMDFFSANGVPLRALITLSMSQPNYQFDQADSGKKGNVDQPFVLPDGSASQLALDVGDPTAARSIATANGLDSLRSAAGGEVAVGGSVSIGAAVAFSAGGGAGIGLGAGIGVGIGGGVGAGANAGVGLGVSAGVGVGAGFGGASSAGVSASAGAFGGIRAASDSAGGKYVETQRLLAQASAPGIASGAVFDVSGKAIAQKASTFKAEVGATSGMRFDSN
jgi:hypothetical protein